MRDIVATVLKVCIVLAFGAIGIMFVRQAFTNGMQTVIASQPAPTKVDSSPLSSWDSDCVLGPMNDRPVNQNRCHAEAIWAKQDRVASETDSNTSLDTGMTKDESEHALLWFGGSMIALLLVLGMVGAGVMWMVKQ